MTFWDFLNWLFGAIDKVLKWFGSAFYYSLYIIDNVWGWIVARANEAFNNAVSWAAQAIANVRATVSGWINAIYPYITQIANTIKTNYLAAIAYLKATVDGLINAVKMFALGLYNTAIAYIITRVSLVALDIATTKKSLLQAILDAVKPTAPLIPFASWLGWLAGKENAAKISNLVGALYGQANLLFSNPLGYLYGIVWSTFIEFLSFIIAYGLGTVNATLPPRPNWGGTGTLPNDGGVTGPPPGTSGLVRPVTPLYVSGYTFGASHPGTDFGLKMDQPVFAAHDGIVTYAGWDTTGYGVRVDIQGEKWWSRYGHNNSLLVSVNQQVKAGQQISRGDSTGNSTGPHLHFELKFKGAYVNPVSYL